MQWAHGTIMGPPNSAAGNLIPFCSPKVQAYIKAYARHFGVYNHIRFNCKLVQLRNEKGRWTVMYQDLHRDKFFQVIWISLVD